MISAGALVFAGLTFGFLVASAIWGSKRFRHYREVPAHFDIRGRATRTAPREYVIWSITAVFAALILGIVALVSIFPREAIQGDPNSAIVIASSAVFAAQLFILWLIERWARGTRAG